MIRGVVNARLQGIVTLQATGPSGRMREINAVIDTGFTDFLTLSHEIIDELDLDFAINVQAFLADGSEEILPMFNVTVTWDGDPRRVRAIATRGSCCWAWLCCMGAGWLWRWLKADKSLFSL